MPTRRRFLLAAAGLALTPALARCVADKQAPAVLKEAGPRRRDRLRLACIGTANRGWDNIEALRSEQIVHTRTPEAKWTASKHEEVSR